jgi:parallel beta-helix repeat protein
VGIEIQENSSSNNISGNEILDYVTGIDLNSRYNTIYGNNIHHNGWGIELFADRNIIINNIINANRWYGIDINTNNNVVTENTITNNGEGGEFDCGIEVDGFSNDITYNIISDNNPIGIFTWDTDCSITNNHISNNHQIGIYVFFSHGCIITKNNLIDNGNYNACFENDFIHSLSNRWRRNYWSDKQGVFAYRIKGFIYLGGIYLFQFPWMNFDWLPARKPYDI